MPSDLDTTLRTVTLSGAGQPLVTLVAHLPEGQAVSFAPTPAGLVVGRSEPADVVLDDRSVSRAHARFSVSGDGTVAFEDLGATNGVKLNGARVRAGTMRPGDELRLGDVRVALQVLTGDAALGMVSYDALLAMLSDELVRARTFKRTFALMMLVTEGPALPASAWHARLVPGLRPADRAGWYAPSVALVLLSESSRARAEALAGEMLEVLGALRAGIAVYPADGTTVDALLQAARERSRERPAASGSDGPLRGGAQMTAVWDLVSRVADSNLPILVVGETGAGKEEVARAIHDMSRRRASVRRSVNCASIPASLLESVLFGHEKGAFTGADKSAKGLFEQADGSTLFLDEIGELSAAAQAALLRTLETKTVVRVGGAKEISVDVRIVAATHRDLEAMCADGTFRSDLYYRLGGATIPVPPLRQRKDEILPLATHFLREACVQNGRTVSAFTPEASAALESWPWPGNIRELRNVVERAVVVARGEQVTLGDLPERLLPRVSVRTEPTEPDAAAQRSRPTAPPIQAVATAASDDVAYHERIRRETSRYEIALIEDALARSGGEVKAAAQLLKIPLRTLSHKLRQFGLRGGSSAGESGDGGESGDSGDSGEE